MSTNAFESYIETALWSSLDDAGRPLDRHYDISDFDTETLTKLRVEFEQFLSEALKIDDSADESRLAHDFWLTRNRHGAGFWDGDWPKEIGEKLDALSKLYPEIHIYIGDDGKLYVG